MSITPAQRVEILRASCCIAGADGETTEDELQHLKRLAGALGVGDASLNAMIARAERDKDFYKEQFNILKGEPLECLDVLIELTMANGEVKESEFEVLKGLANTLEVSASDFRERLRTAMGNTNDSDE